MKIEHIALWTTDLERMRVFYETYFGAQANEKYVNLKKGFESYFLTFEGGARLELMRLADLAEAAVQPAVGYAHFAISLGSAGAVDALTARLGEAGYTIAGAPRTTGDGYYESVVLDPDGNLIELTV